MGYMLHCCEIGYYIFTRRGEKMVCLRKYDMQLFIVAANCIPQDNVHCLG
jgi:hypothetical protein